ncbi:MAG: hypothetical protein EOO85_23605, partial [Pedobacter sp.]
MEQFFREICFEPEIKQLLHNEYRKIITGNPSNTNAKALESLKKTIRENLKNTLNNQNNHPFIEEEEEKKDNHHVSLKSSLSSEMIQSVISYLEKAPSMHNIEVNLPHLLNNPSLKEIVGLFLSAAEHSKFTQNLQRFLKENNRQHNE